MEIVCVAVAAWAFDRLAVGALRPRRPRRRDRLRGRHRRAGRDRPGALPARRDARARRARRGARGGRWPLARAARRRRRRSRARSTGGFLGARRDRLDRSAVWPAAPLGRSSRSRRPRCVPVRRARAAVPGPGDDAVRAARTSSACCSRIGARSGSSRCGATARSRPASRSTRAALVFAYAVPSAIGNNITRLGICFGLALVVALAVGSGRRGRVLLAAAAVPLALAQWVPAREAAARRAATRRCGPPTSSRCCASCAAPTRPLGARRGRADRAALGGRLRRAVVPARARLGAPARHRQQRDLLRRAGGSRRPPTAAGCSPTACASSRCPTCRSTTRRSPRGGSCAPACPGCAWSGSSRALARVLGRRRARARQRAGAAAALGRLGGACCGVTRPGTIVVRERYVAAWQVTQRARDASAPRPAAGCACGSRAPGRVELRIAL